jgi:hypothetical protein
MTSFYSVKARRNSSERSSSLGYSQGSHHGGWVRFAYTVSPPRVSRPALTPPKLDATSLAGQIDIIGKETRSLRARLSDCVLAAAPRGRSLNPESRQTVAWKPPTGGFFFQLATSFFPLAILQTRLTSSTFLSSTFIPSDMHKQKPCCSIHLGKKKTLLSVRDVVGSLHLVCTSTRAEL